MALQWTQATSISKCVVRKDNGSSRLNVLSCGIPLSLFDMFLTIRGGGLRT